MRLLSRKQAKELDILAIDQYGISGKILMGNAGKKVAEKAMEILSEIHDPSILVLCGKGNNGGDGFAAAQILNNNKYNVSVHSLSCCKSIKSDSMY